MSNIVDKTNPAYYRDLGEYSALHVTRKWGLGYCLGTALKYIQRAGRKKGQDYQVEIRKAIWYMISHLHEIDPENNPDPSDEELRGKPWYTP